MAAKAQEYKTDRQGMVTLKKGKKTARVQPSSVKAWLNKGFSVGEPNKPVGNAPATGNN